MIPSSVGRHGTSRTAALTAIGLCVACGHAGAPATPAPAPVSAAAPALPAAAAAASASHVATPSAGCLTSGDGYLRASLGGAIEARIDWPNSGTHCEGESRGSPPGVHLSFQREKPGHPNLLLVFGLTGVQPGAAAHEIAANVTVVMQGTTRFYSTRGDSRCTVDTLTQRPIEPAGTFRIEARGFCTQPAHAVRGGGDVLISTFEFAGPVNYVSDADKD